MTLDQIVTWIVIGGFSGLIAGAAVKGIKVGLVGAVVVGILGAFIGGWLFGLLNISVGSGMVGEVFKSAIGAIVLLVVLRALRRL